MDKKAQKKKDRAKRVRKQILLKRAALRAPQEEENKLKKKMKRITKLKKDMGKLNVWADDVFLKMSEQNLSQLEKNCKILKALEEEYRKETENKKNLNESLESKGCLALEEKLNHLHNKLVEEQKALHENGLKIPAEDLKVPVDNLEASGDTNIVAGDLN